MERGTIYFFNFSGFIGLYYVAVHGKGGKA